ncbi:hypothetical protein [Kitasatospora sp. NPDC056184]|uniref:hypothetical protein n=1 Tax=Kitasatospora sp. NPDC056184 TaxID=3345738 RepID=UPI0035D9C789
MTQTRPVPDIPGAHRAHLFEAHRPEPTASDILQAAHAEAADLLAGTRREAQTLRREAATAAAQAEADADGADRRRLVADLHTQQAHQAAREQGEAAVAALVQAREAAEEILTDARILAAGLRQAADADAAKAAEAHSAAVEIALQIREQAQDQAKEVHAAAEDLLSQAEAKTREAEALRAAADAETGISRRQAKLDLEEERAARTAEIDAEFAQAREAAADALADLKKRREVLAGELERMRKAAETEARRLAESAKADGEKDRQRLLGEAAETVRAAEHQRRTAEAMLAKARAIKARRTSWSARARGAGRWFWRTVPWVGLGSAVGLAAQGEYELAVLVGIDQRAAPLLPVAIDVYAVTAFRRKKDVPWALGIMAAANIAAHLATPHASGPKQLIVGVVLVFVTVVWRVHNLIDHHDDDPHDHGPHDGEGVDGDPVEDTTGDEPHPLTSGGRGGTRPALTAGDPSGSASGGPSAVGTGSASGTPALGAGGNPSGTATGNAAATGAATATGNRQRQRLRVQKKTGNSAAGSGGREELRDEVRDRITALITAGEVPSPTALGREYDADPEWVRNQIRAVRKSTG